MLPRLFAVLLALAALPNALAQAPEKTFRDRALHKQRFLRHFSGDPRIHLQWNGSSFTSDPPNFHSMAVFEAMSIKTHDDHIEIQGNRSSFRRDPFLKKVYLAPSPERVRIDVDLQGTDAEHAFAALDSALFYESPATAQAALPTELQYLLSAPSRITAANASTYPACKAGPDGASPHIKPPVVLKSVQPEFSDQASKMNISGTVNLYLSIDDAGRPSNFWVISGAGFGLDAQALQAISNYVFKPALCEGNPTPANVYVDINFQRF